MDSVDKSAFYIYVISRNKMARLGKGYSSQCPLRLIWPRHQRVYSGPKVDLTMSVFQSFLCLFLFITRLMGRSVDHARPYGPPSANIRIRDGSGQKFFGSGRARATIFQPVRASGWQFQESGSIRANKIHIRAQFGPEKNYFLMHKFAVF